MRSTTTIRTRLGPRQLAAAAAAAIVFFHFALIGITAPVGVMLRFVTPPLSSLMLRRVLHAGAPLRLVEAVRLRDLPRQTSRLFILLEDHAFFDHHGVDFESLAEAHRRNRRAGRFAFGGSTITQQLARTLFLSPDKNYFRKYLEIILAVGLDLVIPKNRLLELYLNTVEMGPAVFGIRAAAAHHFKKAPERLSLEQLARLAAILPNPVRYGVYTLHRHAGMRDRFAFLVATFLEPPSQAPEPLHPAAPPADPAVEDEAVWTSPTEAPPAASVPPEDPNAPEETPAS